MIDGFDIGRLGPATRLPRLLHQVAQAAAPEVAADSCCMVLFGASGDLTRRLVVPALYNLAETGLLPEDFTLLGVDIAERSTADWVASLRAMLCSAA